MDPLTGYAISAAIPVVGNLLGGLFGGGSAARRAMEARRLAMARALESSDFSIQALRDKHSRALWGATGQGGDALRALGSNLGSSMAAAGVNNSSATAGALQNAQSTLASQLMGLAQGQFDTEADLVSANRRWALGQEMDWQEQLYRDAQARADQQGAGIVQGLVGIAGAMGNKAPAKTGKTNQPVPVPQEPGKGAPPNKAASSLTDTGTDQGLQSVIQSILKQDYSGMGMPDPRTISPLVNGTNIKRNRAQSAMSLLARPNPRLYFQ